MDQHPPGPAPQPVPPAPGLPPAEAESKAPLYLGVVVVGALVLILVLAAAVMSGSVSGTGPTGFTGPTDGAQPFTPAYQFAYKEGYAAGENHLPISDPDTARRECEGLVRSVLPSYSGIRDKFNGYVGGCEDGLAHTPPLFMG
ncbi:MAG: hypothetical protein JWL97_4246 [Gemmatimonadales bacterium]|nr:hypothetical protein [Gemmatimonadales bacterium]